MWVLFGRNGNWYERKAVADAFLIVWVNLKDARAAYASKIDKLLKMAEAEIKQPTV